MVMFPLRPDVVVFDVIETLFDLGGLEPRFAEVGLPPQALSLWFARVLRDGMAIAACGTYTTFAELGRFHLERLLPADQRQSAGALLEAMGQLDAHPDVAPAFERLRAEGVEIVTLTNSSTELTGKLLDRAGLARHVERNFDVADAMLWKPRRDPYLGVARAFGRDAERLSMVSVHPWDIHGASCAGLLGAWVDRRGDRFLPMMNAPQVRGGSLTEVVDQLVELQS